MRPQCRSAQLMLWPGCCLRLGAQYLGTTSGHELDAAVGAAGALNLNATSGIWGFAPARRRRDRCRPMGSSARGVPGSP